MTTLSVVIPAYNEQEGITDIVHRVLAIKSDLAQVGVRDIELIRPLAKVVAGVVWGLKNAIANRQS